MKIILNRNRGRVGFAWILLLIIVVFVIAIWMTVMLAKCAMKPKPPERWPTQDEVRADIEAFSNEVYAASCTMPDFNFVKVMDVKVKVPDFFVINGPSPTPYSFSNSPSTSLTPDEMDNWQMPVSSTGSGFYQRLAVYTNLPPQ